MICGHNYPPQNWSKMYAIYKNFFFIISTLFANYPFGIINRLGDDVRTCTCELRQVQYAEVELTHYTGLINNYDTIFIWQICWTPFRPTTYTLVHILIYKKRIINKNKCFNFKRLKESELVCFYHISYVYITICG